MLAPVETGADAQRDCAGAWVGALARAAVSDRWSRSEVAAAGAGWDRAQAPSLGVGVGCVLDRGTADSLLELLDAF